MVLVLFFVLCGMLLFSYLYFDQEIGHPSVLLNAAFAFGALCCAYNTDTWGVDLSKQTVYVIVGLNALFVAVGMFFRRAPERKVSKAGGRDRAGEASTGDDLANGSSKLRFIDVPPLTFLIIVALELISLYVLYRGIVSIGGLAGGGDSYSELLRSYRNATIFDNDQQLPFFADKGRKFCDCVSYVFLLALAFNLSEDIRSFRRYGHYLIPIVIGASAALLNGGRLQLLLLTLAGVFLWIFIGEWKDGWRRRASLRKVFLIAGVVAALLGIFYVVRLAVGRTTTGSWGFLDYITMYAGGPIQLLDMYLRDPAPSSGITGSETFYTALANLSNYGLMSLPGLPSVQLEYRYSNGLVVGNVYTAYRRWIADYGIRGAAALCALMSIFFHWFYYRFKRIRDIEPKFSFMLLVYLIPTVPMQAVDSVFYRTVFSFSFVFILLFLWIVHRACVVKPLAAGAAEVAEEGSEPGSVTLGRMSGPRPFSSQTAMSEVEAKSQQTTTTVQKSDGHCR